jgi:hypothetical protein
MLRARQRARLGRARCEVRLLDVAASCFVDCRIFADLLDGIQELRVRILEARRRLWMALNKSANPAASLSPATFVAAAVSERGPAWLTAG